MEKEDGVWRTIRGRRIFIKDGESLGSAMSRSGKFKREDIRETRENKRFVDSKAKFLSENNSNKSQKYKNKLDRYDTNAIKNRGTSQAGKNQLFENETPSDAKTRVERNWGKYSNTDRRELRHEELQKKLADYKANTLQDAEDSLKSWRIYRDRYQKSLDRATNPESKQRFRNEIQDANKEIEKAKATIDSFKAKKQSNNKTKKNDEEYSLYKRAKERPESIDPMTENSTDWEELEKKYAKRYKNESKNFRKSKDMDMEESEHTKLIKEIKQFEKDKKKRAEQKAKEEELYNKDKKIIEAYLKRKGK